MTEKNSRQRELKNRIRLSTSIKIENNELLNDIAESTQIPKSKLLDMAIELLAEKYNK